ncbi:MAG: hypothetical protein KAI47_28340 [Deltaproteobacteria bacterium]|nr:hypothetical protein [Deltaproteobacteria bacterium]
MKTLRTITLALALPAILAGGCSDDTGTLPNDSGPTPDSTSYDTTADLTPDFPEGDVLTPDQTLSPDTMVTDLAKADEGPKSDITAADLSKSDVTTADLGTVDASQPIDNGLPDAPTTPPANGTCATAQTLTVSTTTPTTVQGDTRGTTSEFSPLSCGAAYTSGTIVDWNGPQVYYKVTLTQGMWEIRVKSLGWNNGAAYAFPATATGACPANAAAVDTACTDHWTTDYLALNIKTASEVWYIAVDSASTATPPTPPAGPFTLTLTYLATPSGSTCAAPNAMTLLNNETHIQGSTAGALDEFTNATFTGIDCGLTFQGKAYPFVGGQVYYKVTLAANTTYQITTKATADLALYVVPAATACTGAALNTACTGPTTPDPLNSPASDIYQSGDETVRVKTGANGGDYLIVVDSYEVNLYGDFELSVKPFTPPTNGKCAGPETVTLGQSPVTVSGDTSYPTLTDEYATVKCGLSSALSGPQQYYRMTLAANTTYTFAIDTSWDSALYAFPAATTCGAGTVDTACATHVSDDPFSGKETFKVTTSAAAEDWIVVVDSWDSSDAGPFTLTVTF